jgi:2'-5' RNA ligase
VRLFVAAELPEPVVSALVGWRPALAALRPVAPEALHLTLAFLGERSAREASAASSCAVSEIRSASSATATMSPRVASRSMPRA